ncbi:MAG TPA: transposase family protein [Methanocellales archaeon]|nr:transposase family protein [Methanocellales archaeon]
MKGWTEDEIKLLRRHALSSKDELIKVFPDRSWASIKKKRSRIIKTRKLPEWFSFDLLKDKTIEELAEEKGLNTRTIHRIIQAGGRSVKDFKKSPYSKYELMMADGMFSPCVCCSGGECVPEYCNNLDKWIQALMESLC